MDPWALIVVAAIAAFAVAVIVAVRRRSDGEHAKQLRHARRWQRIEAERRH